MDSEKDVPATDRQRVSAPPLNFKPITEGLGFHPFSDGLPYAPKGIKPTAKTSPRAPSLPAARPSGQPGRAVQAVQAGLAGPAGPAGMTGAGATVAGRPSFATAIPSRPSGPAPRISVPIARGSTTQSGYVPAIPQASRISARPAALVSSVLPDPSAKPIAALELEPSFGFGYLFKRVIAYGVDSVLNLGLCAGALSLALINQDLNPDVLFSPGVLMMACLFLGAFNWAIMTAQEVAFGTTLGKRLFGLGLQGSLSAIFLRAFFFLPGVFFCGLGLLWALVDRRRRCWHDLVVDLQPLEAPRS